MSIPTKIFVGQRNNNKTEKSEIFHDFFEAFAHLVLQKCSKKEEMEKLDQLFEDYEFFKCADLEFQAHVIESCELARDQFMERKLHVFEVGMIKPDEEQIVAFRVLINYLEDDEEDEDHTKLVRIFESIKKFNFPIDTEMQLTSAKFRPRIRLLTRIIPDGAECEYDTSLPVSEKIRPLSDSLITNSTQLTFSVCD